MIAEGYIAKPTKDYLLVDSIQEMDRIKSITIAILNIKNLGNYIQLDPRH